MTDDNARWLIRKTPEGFAKLGDPARALAGEAEPDEMEEHFLDANERMGEALTEIGMALGLPTPSSRITWGRTEILARWASIHAAIQGVTSINDDPMVCAPPPRHEEAIRLLKATLAEVPAGGSAPADEPGIDWKAAYESTVGPAARLEYVQRDMERMRPVVEAVEALVDEWPTNLPYGPYQRRVVDAVAAYRAGGSAPHQGATTDVTGLSAVLAQAEHDASCRCGYTPQAPSDRHRAMAEAAVRALLGAGETTEADQ
jgi:hypothetical protein